MVVTDCKSGGIEVATFIFGCHDGTSTVKWCGENLVEVTVGAKKSSEGLS